MNFKGLPFIIFFLLLVFLSGRIFYLRKKGIHPSSGKGETNTIKRILIPVFFLVFLYWLFEIIRTAFNISFSLLPEFITGCLIQNKILPIVGALLLVVGLITFLFALRDFGDSLRFGLDTKNQGKLITKGIFSFSRNPFFLSLDIYFIGVACVLPGIFFILFTLAAIAGIHFFILKEEHFLYEIHGEEYRDYMQRVPRYLRFSTRIF